MHGLNDMEVSPNDSLHYESKEITWIQNNIKMRRCKNYLPIEGKEICCCGYPEKDHTENDHTDTVPTGAFGEIEFVGFEENIGKFVRVDSETEMRRMLELMTEVWGIENPKLLISVTGGAKYFNMSMKHRLRDVFRRGLIKAAHSTGAWIITGGTYTGVMKHVGEAVKEYGLTSSNRKPVVTIGIAPWGVIQNRIHLVNKEGSWPAKYHIKNHLNQKESFLDPNHSHFILVDDGTKHNFEAEINFRAKLEGEISKMKTDRGDGNADAVTVPIVLLVLEGGPGTLETVKNALEEDTPAVIIKGSGRAADILAYVFKYAETVDVDDNKITMKQMKPSVENDIRKQMKDIKFCPEEKIDLNIQRINDCLKQSELIQILEWDSSSSTRDIDVAMLKALLKANKNQMIDQLKLALASSMSNIGKSENSPDENKLTTGSLGATGLSAIQLNSMNLEELFLDNGVSLNEFLTIKELLWLYNSTGSLDDTMLSAIQQNSVNFVKLFLNNGFRLNEFLTKERLERLYKNVPSENFLKIVCDKMRQKKNKERLKKEITLKEVGQLIQHLLGEYRRPHYLSDSTNNVDKVRDNPEWELFIWSVLNTQQEMAKLFWLHGKECIAAALVASALLRAMSDQTNDKELRAQMTTNSSEFVNLAIGVLNKCHGTNKKKTQDLLIQKLPLWRNNTSCVLIAVTENNKEFISQPACRDLFDNIWMGKLTKENGTWKLLAFIAIPPLILRYAKFKEEEKDEIHCADQTTSSSVQKGKILKQRRRSLHTQETTDGSGDNKSLNTIEKLVYFYTAPVVIFFHNVIAYMIFLGLYSYVLISKLQGKMSMEEILLTVWVVAIFFQEIEQVATTARMTAVQKFLTYIKDGLNIADVIMILLFGIGMILRGIPHPQTLETARVILGVNLIMFFLRLLHIFSVHKELGPKIEMIIRMVQNLAGFALILFTFIVAYAIASYSILYPNTEVSLDTFMAIFRRPYWNIYGELMLDEVEGAANCTNVAELYKNGTYSRCPTVSGKYFVPVLMGVYMLMCNILLLNLLIAVFSYTFQKVQENAEKHWCFQRYKLINEYCSRSFLAPPFLFVEPFLQPIGHFVKKRWLHSEEGSNAFMKRFSTERKLHQFETVMANTFHHEKEETDQESNNNRVNQLVKKIDELQEQQQALTVTIEKRLENVEKQSTSTLNKLQWIVDSLKEHQLGANSAVHDGTVVRVAEKKHEAIKAVETHAPVYHMLEDQVKDHTRSCISPYPGTNLRRFEVPSDKVPWDVEFLEYNPPTYTSREVLAKPDWADKVDLYQVPVVLKFNSVDPVTNTSRVSYTGNYLVQNGIPLNPIGRTGLRSRGNLGRWGPNHAVDPVITRWKLNETGQIMMKDGKPVFEFVAVRMLDTGLWALPGSIQAPGLLPTENLKIVFSEEAFIALREDRRQKKKIKKQMEKILRNGKLIYQGYADDPRNTDNAWLESTVYLYQDENDVLRYFSLTAGAAGHPATWVTASSKLSLYGAHCYFLKLVAERLDASF